MGCIYLYKGIRYTTYQIILIVQLNFITWKSNENTFGFILSKSEVFIHINYQIFE